VGSGSLGVDTSDEHNSASAEEHATAPLMPDATAMFDQSTEAPAQQHKSAEEYIEVPAKITDLNRVLNNGGKLGWTCLRCSFNCKGPFNATKLKAHLARMSGQNVRCCTATDVPPNLLDMYKRQWQQYLEQKNHKKRKAIDLVEESEQLAKAHVAAMIERGTSREARNLRIAQQQQQLIANQPNMLTKSTESKKKILSLASRDS
jgi:hypothetical protein